MIAALRPAAPEPRPCKICGGDAPLYGVVDFNRSCEEPRGRLLPLAGIAIYYRRCAFNDNLHVAYCALPGSREI